MAKEGGGAVKYDPNTEIFQMRAQWKKVEICKNQWHERWSWLLEEREKALAESDAIRNKVGARSIQKSTLDLTSRRSLKPVPVTSTGFIGWLAQKPDCNLEIYTSWLTNVPLRLHDAWDYKDYVGKQQ